VISVRAVSATSADAAAAAPATSTPNVVVIGGSGRIGASTAAALLAALPAANVSLASRTQQSYADAVGLRPQLSKTRHVQCDIDSPSSLISAIKGADLVSLLPAAAARPA
jgi:saccharopine dehydrogenase-like NADP-dependent oxidoreductase